MPTETDDGAGPSFCVDFVKEDLFDAAERFCDETNVCSGHEAGALAYAARRELERQGDAAERALRGRFMELVSEKEDPWTTVSDPIAQRRTRIRRHQARVLVQGKLPRTRRRMSQPTGTSVKGLRPIQSLHGHRRATSP